MTDIVRIGNVDFAIQDSGSPAEREAVIKTLQTFSRMEKVQKDFTVPTTPSTILDTKTVDVVIGNIPDPNHKGAYTSVGRSPINIVTDVTIYINPGEIDTVRKKAANGDYVENTLPATLANELGDVGINLNPDFPTREPNASGNPNPMYSDPYQTTPNDNKSKTDRASIRYENEVGRKPYGLPDRDLNGENDTKDDGKILDHPENEPIFPSDADHNKAVVTINQGGPNPHAEGSPDDSTDNEGDDFDGWAKKFEDGLDALNPASPVDELFDEIRDYFGNGKKNSSPIILDLGSGPINFRIH